MAYQYSQVHNGGENSYPLEESDIRTSLSAPWSPSETHQRQTSFGSQHPLMQSPPYQSASWGPPDTPKSPHLHTQSSYLRDADPRELQKEHSSGKQLIRLLWRIIARFLVSTAICASIVGVFVIYEKMGVLDRDQKHMFNAIFLGLSLILSMNLISAFKSMAGMMRWRLLASSKHTLREVDLILSLSSFQKVLQLLWTWTKGTGKNNLDYEKMTRGRRWGFRLGAIGWIILGLAAQVDVALVGLTFNHESEGAIGYVDGPVNVTQLEYIYADYSSDPIPTLIDQKYAAHLYGLMSTGYPAVDYTADMTVTDYLGHGDYNDWIYFLREWAQETDSSSSQMPRVTNRSVTVYPECTWSAITKGQYGENGSAIELTMADNTTQIIDWMRESEANSTVVVNPIWEAYGPNPLSCGPRCSRIYMFQFQDSAGPPSYGDFFNCTITVSEVDNADPDQKEQQLPDDTALIVAGAFGSEGWKDSAGRQFAKYGPASIWGASNGRGTTGEYFAAWTLGRFSIGVIAAYDAYGPMVPAEGIQSWAGVLLKVKWLNLYLSLGSVLIINLFLGIFVAFKANAVCCKDDSYLSTARLLRPLMDRLGPHGTYCDGKALATTFDRKVAYGFRTSKEGVNVLSMDEDITTLTKKFPNGMYD